MARVGLLSEKLYMTLSSQNVVVEDNRLDRPDIKHWKTVLVRSLSCTMLHHCEVPSQTKAAILYHSHAGWPGRDLLHKGPAFSSITW